MSEIRLTPASFIVLGLLEAVGEATPYDLKAAVAATVGHFWNVQHAQLYAEPQRLAKAGYLSDRRESEGRRRHFYELTERGRTALSEWRATPPAEDVQLRDLGLLQLFFGGDPRTTALARLPVHEADLEKVETMHAALPPDAPAGIRLTMEAGIGHGREWVRFWSEIARDPAAGDEAAQA